MSEVEYSYRGVIGIRPAGIKIEYTAEQMVELIRCRSDPIYFCKYLQIVTTDDSLVSFIPRKYQEDFMRLIQNERFLLCKMSRQSGKGLRLKEDIPTPTGWTTIDQLKIGDKLFDMYGKVCSITYISEDHLKPTYKIIFNDKSEVICDEDHLWELYDYKNDRNKLTTVDTKFMVREGIHLYNSKIEKRFVVPVCKPINLPERNDLLIDPYILGVWLGDGTTGQGSITIEKNDYNELQRVCNFNVVSEAKMNNTEHLLTVRIKDLHTNLRLEGIKDKKYIPIKYLRGSIKQRLALLQGLMDTDGTAEKNGSLNITFSQKYPELLKDVQELLSSLGIKFSLYHYTKTQFPSTTMRFTVNKDEMPLFRYQRKLARQSVTQYDKHQKRHIVAIEQIKTEITRCIKVDSANSTFLCTRRFIPTHNTATVAAMLLWYALFNDHYHIGVLAHKQEQSIDILDRIKVYFRSLPTWLQQGLNSWNTKSIEMENGSKIFAAATSSGAVVGRALNIVYSDEFDLVEPNLQEIFFTTTFPTISSGQTTKFIITTTPRGFKYFYKLWTESEQGKNDFRRFTINYWDVPGRDEAWAAKEKGRIGESRFRSEYITDFIGSSNTLIDPEKLKSIAFLKPITQDNGGYHQIFKHPEAGHIYVLASDVSEGKEGDYSAFSVIDVTKLPYEVVCTYANNQVTPLFYPNVIFDTAKYYNNAYVIIETNAIGMQVANILYYDLEYENVLSTNIKSKNDEVTETAHSYLGLRQTKKTKHVGTSILKALIENDQLFINDYRIFYELTRFVRHRTSWAAEQGEHDDFVMGLVVFAWLTNQNSFKDLTGTDIRQNLDQKLLNDQDTLPLGIVNNFYEEPLVNNITISEFDLWMRT